MSIDVRLSSKYWNNFSLSLGMFILFKCVFGLTLELDLLMKLHKC